MSALPQLFVCPYCNTNHSLFNADRVFVYVCGHCNTVMWKREKGFEKTQNLRPAKSIQLIPLGASGTLRGKKYTVITFAERTEVGAPYYWIEYTLQRDEDNELAFLSFYNGHWNLAELIENDNIIDTGKLPDIYQALWKGEQLRCFSRYRAKYQHASGEFHWEVNLRGNLKCLEFIDPPEAIIVEYERDAPKEADVYKAVYVLPGEVSNAFREGAAMPSRIGVGALQPFFIKFKPRRLFTGTMVFCVLLLLVQLLYNMNRKEQILFSESVVIDHNTFGKPRVTPSFKLDGKISNLEVEINSDITNNWCAADVDLVNEQTGEEKSFAVEASYYSGVENGESWSEGGPVQTEFVCSIPPGTYHFVVTPATEATGPPVQFTITAVWDVPTYWNGFLLAGIMLLSAGALVAISDSFETRRGE